MYIDFHNHLDFYDKEDINKIIYEIENNKITTLACSMDEKSYLYNKELSKLSKYIIPTFGIHPNKAYENRENIDKYDSLIKHSQLIGEIGLDFYWIEDKNTYKSQIKVFEYFLIQARKYSKYINVHTKGAEELILELIKKYDISTQTIIHWYSGDINVLKKLIDSNCLFTASIDLKYSEKSREIVSLIPTENLLAETDGPTALQWISGEWGMPKKIMNVYEDICRIKKINICEFKNNCQNHLNKIIKSKI
ncbi:PHP superfamily hydrolase [[Clostridium] sordellii]|uniref:TatD family hydrolase n=1 Tax=Paraclostridium sordellii TaxID=1505 RepID=UPI0005E2947F|nr:TatD family hydrolase [Paeniclostridium sordellii]MBX9181710.1 TatD family hydrolase [Paeniclostridium sordellii]CEO15055.1 PHP superfamily hydrolase [[Clostridium] sordellii] [Paeniclostridium sordellii]CEP83337.1 PHP superfamily hydrolase [[Clostridium] sordellii] [Paeniclostridium sordellii]